ncbi:Asp23/Gls24 family envelope stress response protein [Plantibacter flavus]|uniref:hypothetical protein n=1 Tax=Plantibacter flavus TaxID=150123 RepID=UPI003F161092
MNDDPEQTLDGLGSPDLDGHTIDELSDYLDSGREPRDPSIERSPGCQLALDALARLRAQTWSMLEAEAADTSDRDRDWMRAVLANISLEAHAGRDIPLSHPDPEVHLRVSEGSVRALIRSVGDGIGGVIVGRVSLDGDVTTLGAPVTVAITASAAFGTNLDRLAQLMRDRVTAQLALHTELNVVAVDVTILDIHMQRIARPEES